MAELENAYRTWAAYESQLRAILGLYVLEGQLVQLYRVPPTTSHLSNPFVSACDDQVFAAPNARAWRAALKKCPQKGRRENTFATIYRHIYDEQFTGPRVEVQLQLTTLSKAVLIVGIHSLIAQLRETRGQGLLHDLSLIHI